MYCGDERSGLCYSTCAANEVCKMVTNPLILRISFSKIVIGTTDDQEPLSVSGVYIEWVDTLNQRL